MRDQLEDFVEKLKTVLVVRGIRFYQKGYEKDGERHQPLLGIEHWDRIHIVVDLEKACGVKINLKLFDREKSASITIGELYSLFYPKKARAA